jgi:hypothetical protein
MQPWVRNERRILGRKPVWVAGDKCDGCYVLPLALHLDPVTQQGFSEKSGAAG